MLELKEVQSSGDILSRGLIDMDFVDLSPAKLFIKALFDCRGAADQILKPGIFWHVSTELFPHTDIDLKATS